MESLKCLHHMVHVGFDEKEQPELTGSIKKRIEDISDKAGHVLNFVDEPLYSQAEAEKVQVLKLSNSLGEFVSFQNLKGTPLGNMVPDQIETLHPEVLQYFMQVLNGKWQKLREPCQKEMEFLEKHGDIRDGMPMLPTDVQQAIKDSDKLYHQILSNDFLDILLQTVDHFYGRNIFNFRTSENISDTKATNQERREDIMEYAQQLVGDDRIMVSGMNDADISKIAAMELDVVEKFEQRQEALAKSGITYEVWEQHHGNAEEYVWNTNSEITKMRYERYKGEFFSTLKSKGFEIVPEITQHVLGGEYYKRCIHSYKDLLHMYGLPSDRMEVDPSISLIHTDDMKKYQVREKNTA